MIYRNIKKGHFLVRLNRFIAQVELMGQEVTCHVKNTGRCKELLTPGTVVYLEDAFHEGRKTQYDLIAVEKGKRLINMDAAAPNAVFYEWVTEGCFLPGVTKIQKEQTFGESRLDFLVETEGKQTYVEVKGVTLEENGVVRFPDAPTKRGVKHIETLIRAVQMGYDAALFFVVQMQDVLYLEPNDRTHPAFGDALRRAKKAGVRLEAYDCRVTPYCLSLRNPVSIRL